uniref:U3 small nucleolar ribonucleoprotein protein MPP10 n=1 Tax=Arcella intermedia TaxID=1963864 RepID=A0A6B2KZR8_9EUKA|eukprot:TRINITY_DN1982_c0_g1_i1.p1 TRINITY_DN1982_c0_g1~~TRINITY_DN1982_c0_g1_i1.p1  ORF type:complete len:654 (-),score=277.39 TRINITY_DN1982_c0_g1_i1:127-2088(-)
MKTANPGARDDALSGVVGKYLEEVIEKPLVFLEPSQKLKGSILDQTKKLYDYAKQHEFFDVGESLPELLVDGFDNDQIWEEMELRNGPLLKLLNSQVQNILRSDVDFSALLPKSKKQKIEVPENEDSDFSQNDFSGDDDFNQEDEEEEQDEKERAADEKMFFSMQDMEKFIEEAENKEAGYNLGEDSEDEQKAMALLYGEVPEKPTKTKSKPKAPKDQQEEEGFNNNEQEMDSEEERLEEALKHYAGELPDNGPGKKDTEELEEEDMENAKYDDWFAPSGKSRGSDIGDDIEDHITAELEEEVGVSNAQQKAMEMKERIRKAEEELIQQDIIDSKEELSTFQKQQEKLKRRISQLEEQNLKPKEWQFSGEAQGSARPMNSLLEVDVEFEHATKVAPIITEEVTKTLEEIIQYRIVNNAFDDVIRKTPMEAKRKNTVALDGTKSKQSLAEVYENEYLEKTQNIKKEDPLDPQHRLLSAKFLRLCNLLDALSGTSYYPRHKAPKKTKADKPTIQMEEVTPITATAASQLAPQEIYERKEKLEMGETEKTREDRRKERREKKEDLKKVLEEKHKREKEREAKQSDPTKGSVSVAVKKIKDSSDKNVKFVKGNDTTNYSQSSALFQKLQNDARNDAQAIKNRSNDSNTNNSSAKYKL